MASSMENLSGKLEMALASLDEEIERRQGVMNELTQECERLRQTVASDNRERDALLRLETLENELESHRRATRALESSRRSTRNRLNTILLQEENDRYEVLQESIRQLREQKKHIREELIPGLQIELNQLHNECDRIDEEIRKLSTKLKDLPANGTFQG